MSLVVQKYGGSSLADLDCLRSVARAVANRHQRGQQVVVVVSAMGDGTNTLLAQAKELDPAPPRRELDMLLSAGERMSAALFATALHAQGVDAVSLTGSQCGIITNDRHVDARIIEVRPVRISDELQRGRVVVVAGFQGMSYRRDITTLGRGGSDTTAVALAAALGAESCEIYSDVDGVLSADPRIVPLARRMDAISYAEMQEFACAGARVLNADAVEFAKRAGIALYARKTGADSDGTLVRLNPPPTSGGIRGVAYLDDMLVLRARGDALHSLGELMARRRLRPNLVSRLGAPDQAITELWCARDNIHDEAELRAEVQQKIPAAQIDDGLASVSLIGEGMLDDGQRLTEVLAELEQRSVPCLGLSTSSFRISLLVDKDALDRVVQALHHRFVEVEAP